MKEYCYQVYEENTKPGSTEHFQLIQVFEHIVCDSVFNLLIVFVIRYQSVN